MVNLDEVTSNVAVIVGSGAHDLFPEYLQSDACRLSTPYGDSSDIKILKREYTSHPVLFRHGLGHSIPPHRINYRANLWALANLQVTGVISVATVGGISPGLKPGDFLIPVQVVDYTWARHGTYYDGESAGGVAHVDMTSPFCEAMRKTILHGCEISGFAVHYGGVYAVTQGPRFETPAEIDRIDNDGGDVVGMTLMPEASLALELNLCYAAITVIVNFAAGRGGGEPISSQVEESSATNTEKLNSILFETLRNLDDSYDAEATLLRP